MYVEAKQIIKWKPTKKPHPLLACALCGRKMAEDEDSMSAIWRAQGGQYIQAYHVECAKIVKLWGYPSQFLSPKAAERWACEMTCNVCDNQLGCSRYVFECRKAMDALRILGGCSKNPKGPDNENE